MISYKAHSQTHRYDQYHNYPDLKSPNINNKEESLLTTTATGNRVIV